MSGKDKPTLLLVGADPGQHRLAAAAAQGAGWRIEPWAEGHPRPECRAILLIRWDLGLIERLRAALPANALLACAEGTAALEAVRAGASDTLALPLERTALAAALAAAADRRQRRGELRPIAAFPAAPMSFEEMVGSDPAFRAAVAIAAKAARGRSPLLIEGERGTGRETLAHAVHAAGARAARPFVAIDCASVMPNFIESHLFGHERGAFPGAFDSNPGRVAAADGGTLFLDRIDELPAPAQARLLHLIVTGEARRMGAVGASMVDLRIVAGCTRPLAAAVSDGRFDAGLHRLLCASLAKLPPLRERRGDVQPLAAHFLARLGERSVPRGIDHDAEHLLAGFGWPGNVRQLRDAVTRAALASGSTTLAASDFPQIALERGFTRRADDHRPSGSLGPPAGPGVDLYDRHGHLRPLDAIEADIIRLAIGRYHGRMTEVARRLGIGRSTLYRKLGELGIDSAA